jgi:hypothetical protein
MDQAHRKSSCYSEGQDSGRCYHLGHGIYIVGVSWLGAVAFRVTGWHVAYLMRL